MSKYFYNLGLYFQSVADNNCGDEAFRFDKFTISYRKLLSDVKCLAQILLEDGCLKGDIIAIAHTKNYLSFVMMLAALRIGVTYVNIDAFSPTERNLKILRRAQPKLIYSDDECGHECFSDICAVADFSHKKIDDGVLSRPLTENQLALQKDIADSVDGSTLAYLMFTSGSTGEPKGVAVSHQNVIHFIEWGKKYFSVGRGAIFANLSPMYFDNSVFDFYVGIFSGATLVPVNKDLLTKPYELIDFIEKMECSIWFSVPSLLIYLMTMKAIDPSRLRSIKQIIFGGEGYPKSELYKLYSFFQDRNPPVKLVNVYGPTECTCICSAYLISDSDFLDMTGLPPLGSLNENFDFKIINEGGVDSAKGELCLIGPNVASGYFNDPIRTKASFISLDDSRAYMKRMYITGDLVHLKDGIFHFIGRKDNQIKHMGYRIELEEIERALLCVPGITEAAVVYQKKGDLFGYLVAFIASKNISTGGEIENLISKQLPSYMQPSRYYFFEFLPKNQNGKIDRSGLNNYAE